MMTYSLTGNRWWVTRASFYFWLSIWSNSPHLQFHYLFFIFFLVSEWHQWLLLIVFLLVSQSKNLVLHWSLSAQFWGSNTLLNLQYSREEILQLSRSDPAWEKRLVNILLLLLLTFVYIVQGSSHWGLNFTCTKLFSRWRWPTFFWKQKWRLFNTFLDDVWLDFCTGFRGSLQWNNLLQGWQRGDNLRRIRWRSSLSPPESKNS